MSEETDKKGRRRPKSSCAKRRVENNSSERSVRLAAGFQSPENHKSSNEELRHLPNEIWQGRRGFVFKTTKVRDDAMIERYFSAIALKLLDERGQ